MEPKLPEATPPTPDQAQPSVPATEQPAAPINTAPSTDATQSPLPESGQTPPPPPTTPPTTPNNLMANLLKNKKLLYIAAGAGLLLLLILSLVLMFSGGKDTKQVTTNNKPKAQTETKKQAPKPADTSQTVVYGTWTSQQSVIRAVNTVTNQSTTLVSLPLTVKKISVLSNNTLLYIDHIDSDEYGTRINVYDLKQKQITINIPAEAGLSIADYILSPNKKYMAIWEVSKSKDTNTLQGGQSGVYTVDLTRPTVTNKLFTEQIQTTPVHYPRAILNDGTVFTDTYLPSTVPTDPGWENGLSKIDVDGTNQKDIGAATAGTYSSQPVLSPDQKYLLFAGYDGSSGDGTATRSGVRQAILSPNTVDILNTQSLQRFKLPNLPAGSIYATPQWDNLTGNPIITILSSTSTQRGFYVYDLGKQSLTRLPITYPGSTFIAQLPKAQTLIGTQSTDSANLGNLGPTETYAFTQLAVIDATGQATYLSVQDPFMQYIATLPGNYFPPKN